MAYPILDRRALPNGVNFATYEKARKKNEGLPILGNGYAGNLIGGLGSSFFGGLGDTASFVGLNNVADVLHRGGNYFEEHLPDYKPAEFSSDWLTSPNGLARGVGQLGGAILSIAAPTALVPGGAYAKGAEFLSKLPLLGKVGQNALEMGLRGSLTAPMEASMEAGNYIENAIANGEDPEVARQKSWDIFKKMRHSLRHQMRSNGV